MTEHAQVAKLIRTELKQKYPHVKFSVTSSSFANGDSVDVRYTMEDESYPRSKEIDAIISKYEAGTFDGMTDSYNYHHNRTGPTVKYAMVQVDTSPLEEKHKPDFLKYWGLKEFTDEAVRAKLNCWKEQALHRYIHEVVLK